MKKLLILGVVVLSFAFAATAMAADPSNLIGWWKFDENAEDASPNNLDGTLVGVNYVLNPGFGYAYNFNGIENLVVPDNSLLEPFDAITLEAWVMRSDSPGSYRYIISKYLPTRPMSYSSYGLYTGPNGGLSFYVGRTSGYVRSAQALPTDIWNGNWHYVAGTYDGIDVKLFIDGKQVIGDVDNAQDIFYEGTGNLYIGSYNGNSPYSFIGLVDNVRIWKTALSAEELGMTDKELECLLNDDTDCDGVSDEIDLCDDTYVDKLGEVPSDELGVNRHVWYGKYGEDGEYFSTLIPGTKGAKNPAQSEFSIINTRGCSCAQILASMDGKMNGHKKFGCSTSVIEDFIAGLPQRVRVDTVSVDANNPNSVLSNIVLKSGVNYELEAMGTAYAGGNYTNDIEFDAKYSITHSVVADTWTDSVTQYESYGPTLLDLFVNGSSIDWGVYNDEHTYYHTITGAGAAVNLLISDIYYPNNIGFITVNIFRLP